MKLYVVHIGEYDNKVTVQALDVIKETEKLLFTSEACKVTYNRRHHKDNLDVVYGYHIKTLRRDRLREYFDTIHSKLLHRTIDRINILQKRLDKAMALVYPEDLHL